MLLVRASKYHKYISLKAKRKIKSEKMTGHEGACFDYNKNSFGLTRPEMNKQI